MLALIASPAQAADPAPAIQPVLSAAVTAGGLTCFTITPAQPPQTARETASCDQLCAGQGAACSGMQTGALNPPPDCATRYLIPSLASCRCCKVR